MKERRESMLKSWNGLQDKKENANFALGQYMKLTP